MERYQDFLAESPSVLYIRYLRNNKILVGTISYLSTSETIKKENEWTLYQLNPVWPLHGPEREPVLMRFDTLIEAEIEEFKKTIELMKYHGIENVRGSIFTEVQLSDNDITFLNAFMIYTQCPGLLFTRPYHENIPLYIENAIYPYVDYAVLYENVRDWNEVYCVYVLTIEHGYYYVGYCKYVNIEYRIDQHKKGQGQGASWTKGHNIKCYSVFGPYTDKRLAIMEELKISLIMFGVHDSTEIVVRGGPYVERDLDEEEVLNIRRLIADLNDACFICYRKGHFARNCNEVVDKYDKEIVRT
ncbi:unnamed protein product [Blepharisma stoltei]|uniref:GIY-YIG homing endonuclease n=1 Tax=Blepharisma stoltei TaxID=1481888 RepID=A0AAU9JAV0_9CILI|nr:unnamed protein product [Blepharisma stoltei]